MDEHESSDLDPEPDYAAACCCDETLMAEAGFRSRKGEDAADQALREALQTRVAESPGPMVEVARGLLERGASAEEIRAYFAADAAACCLLFVLEDALGGSTGS